MSKSITQDMAYRQFLMKYAEKYGVSRASRKYNKSRSYIYFWKARWDGTAQSLACQSRHSHGHPSQHTEAELKLIRDMRRRNPDLGMVELWHRLRKRGYTRRPESLFRIMRKLGLFPATEKKKAYRPQALRADDLSRPACPGGCEGSAPQVYCRSGAEAAPVYRHRRVHPPALSGSLPGTKHLLLRRLLEKVVQVVCPPGHPGRMRSDGQRL